MERQQDIPGIDMKNLEPGLAQVIIQPGSEVPPLGDTTTVNLHVQDGSVQVTVSEGTGEARVKKGPAICLEDGTVFCESGNRDLAISAPVVLTAGNSCFVKNGVLHMKVVGDKPVELHVGATQRSREVDAVGGEETERGKLAKKSGLSGGGGITTRACWVCPGTRP
jgi:hypothetical protein